MWGFLAAAIAAGLPAHPAAFKEAAFSISSSASMLDSSHRDYQAFRQKHRRVNDTVSYKTRQQLFKAYCKEVEEHNMRRPAPSWVAVVNHLADYTEEERHALLGYKRLGPLAGAEEAESDVAAGTPSSLLQDGDVELVATADWRKLSSSTFIRDQGACGSCWAVAAIGALEMHAELRGGPVRKLSANQLVDCTPNPRNCGGAGGCKGATAELAFLYASQHGLADEDDYGYMAFDGKDRPCLSHSVVPSASVGSYRRLPTNKLLPLLRAVSTKGPVVVSVDADKWAAYGSGVFNGCSRDATVNHAVLMVGYGHDPRLAKDYYLIRNSWGSLWGEHGYIRIERHNTDQGADGFCGTDYDPKKGVGCDGGASKIPVCGMCGILSDSSYPTRVSVRSKQDVLLEKEENLLPSYLRPYEGA